MNDRKKIVVFCNKYLGFTLLSSGGILDDLFAHFDVIIITNAAAREGIQNATKGRCKVVIYNFKSTNNFKSTVSEIISDILGMTYAIASDGRKNLTGALHRKAHLNLAKKAGFSKLFKQRFVVSLAEFAESCYFLRKLFVALFHHTANKRELSDIISTISPALCLATTMGLGDDGVFFAASKSVGARTIAIIQSWDRTASKGYPASPPDHCIVWNDAMKREAVEFLDIHMDNVYVEGAPPWDKYLLASSPLMGFERSQFLSAWGLKENKQTVFFAINGPATHEENLKLIRHVCLAMRDGVLTNIQAMFRVHPSYMQDNRGKEFLNIFNQYKVEDAHLMYPIITDTHIKDYIVTEDDRIFMHNMFRVCDVTVSIMSTWMIESAIFDKPNICIEYGRYNTELYDFDLSDYKAEHIQRIFSYDAVHRVKSAEAMINEIVMVLKDPGQKKEQRKRLADIETGPFKGFARKAFFDRILEISKK